MVIMVEGGCGVVIMVEGWLWCGDYGGRVIVVW